MADQVPTTSETAADIPDLERELLANYAWGELLNNITPATQQGEDACKRWNNENGAILARIEALPVLTPGVLRLKALAVATIDSLYSDARPANETADARLSRQIVQALAMAPAIEVAP